MSEKIKSIASRTAIKGRLVRKTNPELSDTIRIAMKNDAWRKISAILSNSTRAYASINLGDIDKNTSAGDTVIIPGKILSSGNITKKIRICALSISADAKEKLKATKSEFATIAEEIKINPKANGVKLIR